MLDFISMNVYNFVAVKAEECGPEYCPRPVGWPCTAVPRQAPTCVGTSTIRMGRICK